MKPMVTLLVAGILLAACTPLESADTMVTASESSPEREFLMDALEGLPRPTGDLELGRIYSYEFFIHCGMRYLRPAPDNRNWETSTPPFETGRYPESWRQAFSNPRESISPELLGTLELVSDDTLLFRVPGFNIEAAYTPTATEIPGCA